jgi:hypothetical protein
MTILFDLRVAEEAVMNRARRAVGEAFRVLGLDPPLNTLVANGDSFSATRWG